MRKMTTCLTAVGMLTAMLLGQAQMASFEVAAVKPNDSMPSAPTGGTVIRPEQFHVTWYPLQALVSLAYGVPNSRITGWPEWTRTARYDVRAKTGKPSTRQEVLAMLQTLLATRFSLKAHRETREMDIYGLVVARADGTTGPALQRVVVDCESKTLRDGSAPGLFPPDARPACGSSTVGMLLAAGPVVRTSRFSAVTMEQLASGMAGNVGRPVFDRTGLTGTFDLELRYVAENPQGPFVSAPSAQPPDGVSYRQAIKEQLGLDLRPERGPVESLVIDSIEPPTPD
jgi:uncharacterized protein (TIGR03435 family)